MLMMMMMMMMMVVVVVVVAAVVVAVVVVMVVTINPERIQIGYRGLLSSCTSSLRRIGRAHVSWNRSSCTKNTDY